MTKIRAVVFDYGEVLSAPANHAAHSEMVAIAGLPEKIFDERYWAWRLDYDAARLNGVTYWEKVAAESGTSFSASQIRDLIACDCRMWMDINPPMLAWAAELRQMGFTTGILSNMGEDTLRAMRREFQWLPQFVSQTWSCELGVTKPDLAIYRDPLRQLRLKAQEVLFIDNLKANVAGAVATGMRGIVFTDIEQLCRELERQKLDLPEPEALAADRSGPGANR